MIGYKYKRLNISIEHSYFSADIFESKADIIRYHQAKFPHKNSSKFCSPIIHLKESEESILMGYRKSTRYEIRSIINEDLGLLTHQIRSPDLIIADRFIRFYDSFANIKSLPISDKRFISAIQKNLMISYAALNEDDLVFHAYLFDNHRIRLLYSATSIDQDKVKQSELAKINKLLHHHDILWSKDHGFAIYDLGGVDFDNKALAGINKFKTGFSNCIEETFEFTICNTLQGKLLEYIKNFLSYK